MIELRRFKALTDSYGADLHRWPEEARIDAAAFVRVSVQARVLLDAARALDEVIDAASERADALQWPHGELRAAAARLCCTVLTQIA